MTFKFQRILDCTVFLISFWGASAFAGPETISSLEKFDQEVAPAFCPKSGDVSWNLYKFDLSDRPGTEVVGTCSSCGDAGTTCETLFFVAADGGKKLLWKSAPTLFTANKWHDLTELHVKAGASWFVTKMNTNIGDKDELGVGEGIGAGLWIWDSGVLTLQRSWADSSVYDFDVRVQDGIINLVDDQKKVQTWVIPDRKSPASPGI